MEQVIRWKQRFNSFKKALSQFENAVNLSNDHELSGLEELGLIHVFEFTHELAWKTIKDFIVEQGTTKIYGSKDATREAFQLGLITDGEGWMEMIRSRNESSHTYNEKIVEEISKKILDSYYDLFVNFKKKMEGISSGN